MIEVKVRCSGQLHRIVLKDNGKLVLVDHPNYKEELALLALGGVAPDGCLAVLDAWARQSARNVPHELVAPLHDAAGLYQIRQARRYCGDPLRADKDTRMKHQIERVAAMCLSRAFYATNVPCRVVVSHRCQKPSIERDRCLTAVIPWTWYRNVYRRGLALIDGLFVTAIEADPHGYEVALAPRPPFFYDDRRARLLDNGTAEWLE